MKKHFAMRGTVLGVAVGAALAAAGPAAADGAVSIRPAVGAGAVLPEADVDFARALVSPDDAMPHWTRVDRPDGSVSFVHGETQRCLDLSDPDDGGSAVVVRDCAPESLSQRWERRGLALVDRDTGECVTQVTRGGTAILAAAECVLGDPRQEWAVSP